jgi:hypothetical protein
MSIANVTESWILALVYNATAIATYAATTGSQTNIGVSLHTADPGETGNAGTNEVTYTSYTRVNVARTTGGWTVSGTAPTKVSPVANIDFPAGTGGSGTATHFATAASNATPPTGAQDILWSGTVTPNIVTGNGVTPRLTTASSIELD